LKTAFTKHTAYSISELCGSCSHLRLRTPQNTSQHAKQIAFQSYEEKKEITKKVEIIIITTI
jgi:hypothetical protein